MLDLTAQDRCDRCGAQALAVAHKPGNSNLMFCGHHHRQYAKKLIETYWLIESDESPASPVPVAAYTE